MYDFFIDCYSLILFTFRVAENSSEKLFCEPELTYKYRKFEHQMTADP